MPELPEVTTIIRLLSPSVLNKTISKVDVFYKNLIKSDYDIFTKEIINKTINSITRTGKFIVFHLSENYRLIVHLRMEGKLFYFKDFRMENRVDSDSLLFTFSDNTYLLFNDTRKFGVMYLEKEDSETSVLDSVAKDPLQIETDDEIEKLYKEIHKKRLPIKESLLNQNIISGLGNIYADEVLFATRISPFKKSNEITLDQVKEIIKESKRILTLAIANNGSTVDTYHPAFNEDGNFQNFLKVYGRYGEKCSICGTKIEKRFLKGRGTSFCRHCQGIKPSFSITGPIASGKSTLLQIFEQNGFVTLSLDKLVRDKYSDKTYIKECAKKFPAIVKNDALDLVKLQALLINNPSFKREYQNFLYPQLKEMVNNFLNDNYDKYVAVEVPLLFEARMNNLFTYNIGIISKNQEEFLANRGEKHVKEKLELNKNLLFFKHLQDLDLLIKNDGTYENLKENIEQFINSHK